MLEGIVRRVLRSLLVCGRLALLIVRIRRQLLQLIRSHVEIERLAIWRNREALVWNRDLLLAYTEHAASRYDGSRDIGARRDNQVADLADRVAGLVLHGSADQFRRAHGARRLITRARVSRGRLTVVVVLSPRDRSRSTQHRRGRGRQRVEVFVFHAKVLLCLSDIRYQARLVPRQTKNGPR